MGDGHLFQAFIHGLAGLDGVELIEDVFELVLKIDGAIHQPDVLQLSNQAIGTRAIVKAARVQGAGEQLGVDAAVGEDGPAADLQAADGVMIGGGG